MCSAEKEIASLPKGLFNYDVKLRLYTVFILNFFVLLKKETYLEKYSAPIYPAHTPPTIVKLFLLLCFFVQIQVHKCVFLYLPLSYIKDSILCLLSYTIFFQLTIIYPGDLSISVHSESFSFFCLFLFITALNSIVWI